MKKKYLIQLSVIFIMFMGIGGLSSTQAEASELKAEVNTKYMLLDDLSIDQQQQIIKEQPNQTIDHDEEQFILVYSKDAKQLNTTEPKGQTDRKEKINVTKLTKVNEGKLPQTGSDDGNLSLMLLGGGILVLSIGLLVWKRKQIKQFLAVLLILGSLGATINVKATTTDLKEPIQETINKGMTYNPDIPIEGFSYVGFLHTYSDKETPKQPPAVETGTVVVKYVDEQGKTLSDQQELKGNLGETYQAIAVEIEGYTVKEVQGTEQGKFQKESQEVTYVYSPAVETGTVVVKYVDEQGKTLSDQQELKGNLGETYQAIAVEIEGYTVKEVQGTEQGKFQKESQEVTYVYSPVVETGTVQLLLNNEVEKLSIYNPEDGTFKEYSILYFVWYSHDINSKVDSLTLSGQVDKVVEIPSPYKGLFEVSQWGYSDVRIYPVIQDDSGEKVYKDGYFSLDINVYDSDYNVLFYDAPLRYMNEEQIIPMTVHQAQPV